MVSPRIVPEVITALSARYTHTNSLVRMEPSVTLPGLSPSLVVARVQQGITVTALALGILLAHVVAATTVAVARMFLPLTRVLDTTLATRERRVSLEFKT